MALLAYSRSLRRLLQQAAKYVPQRSAGFQSLYDPDQEKPAHDSFPSNFFQGIHKILDTDSYPLQQVACYHFNGSGKAIRPTIVMLVARAFNYDANESNGGELTEEQLVISMVAEMIHTASLVHDDVIDDSLTRRGKPSVFSLWGQGKAAYTGDFILSSASVALAKLRHNRVMQIMSEILENLVKGEFMQLGTKEHEDERFNHYIEKSYRKTASLIANSCKAAAVLSGTCEDKIMLAYEYGKNVGIAFQIMDDVLDYNATEEAMGKPTAADLKLGLATAPVLFASHEFPRLNTLIMRRFSRQGDQEEALELVKKSSGLEQAQDLAMRYSHLAIKAISSINQSPDAERLIEIAHNLQLRKS